ncbi:hypothetical protein GCM10009549_22510 [Streptomyces thermoalcalitolerans]|uniref:Uncharacterized protein n=1 Tax=Streptomyces thermoalcalitolerans TaxID=65605 RepID=A0ABN1NLB9_9ACTN
MERAHRTLDGRLRHVRHDQAAHRAVVSGGGFDAEDHALRDGGRETVVAAVSQGACGRAAITSPARTGPLVRVCGAEGATVDRIDRPELSRGTRANCW